MTTHWEESYGNWMIIANVSDYKDRKERTIMIENDYNGMFILWHTEDHPKDIIKKLLKFVNRPKRHHNMLELKHANAPNITLIFHYHSPEAETIEVDNIIEVELSLERSKNDLVSVISYTIHDVDAFGTTIANMAQHFK